MTDETKESSSGVKVQARIAFNMRRNMTSVYAQHMLAQAGEHEIVLSFFELIPPLILDGPKRAEQLKMVEEQGVPAECVARVTIPKDKFPAFVAVLNQFWNEVGKSVEAEKNVIDTKHDKQS